MFIQLQGKHGPVFIRPGTVMRIVSQPDGTTVRLDNGEYEFVNESAANVRQLVEEATK